MTATKDRTEERTTAEARRIVIAALRARHADGQPVSNAAVRAAAAQLGLSTRHVRRLLREDHTPLRTAFQPTDEHVDAYYAAHGNAVKALKLCRKRGIPVPVGERAFQRAIQQRVDPALRAGAKEGWSGVVNRQGYLPRHIPHKCYGYSIDHTPPPVLIRPDGDHPEAYLLWETTVIDEATRFELVVYTSDGAPDTTVTVAALAAAVSGYETDDGTFIGGKPLHVLSDNGSDLRTSPATAGLVVLGVKRQFSGVGQPWQNGRVERKHRTVQDEWCADLPGYIPPNLSQKDRDAVIAYWRSHPELLLTRDQYDALRHAEQMRYNFERGHFSLGGRTPFHAWSDDPYLPERADDEQLRLAMLSRANRVVSKGRIRIFSTAYYSDDGTLSDLHGLSVEVRFLPGRTEHVEVFRNGEHLCRAYTREALPGAAASALAANRDKKRTAFLAHSAAGARILSERTRDALADLGFDDDLPTVPADGQSPWGSAPPDTPAAGASDANAPDAAEQAPAQATGGTDTDKQVTVSTLNRPSRKPRNYPEATPEEVAHLATIVSTYREANGEFA